MYLQASFGSPAARWPSIYEATFAAFCRLSAFNKALIALPSVRAPLWASFPVRLNVAQCSTSFQVASKIQTIAFLALAGGGLIPPRSSSNALSSFVLGL